MQEGLVLLLTGIQPASITQHFIMDPLKDGSESCDSVLGDDAIKKYVCVNVSRGAYYSLPQRLVA